MKPIRIRFRLSDAVWEKGAVFSAYFDAKVLVVEDVLVWNNETVWSTKPFSARRHLLQEILNDFTQDILLQGITLDVANYKALSELVGPDPDTVLEFVPERAGQRKIIWIPDTRPVATATKDEIFVAKREQVVGPDVFSVWRGEEKLGLAMVRTLAISRALRTCTKETIPVKTTWNKQFEKWEILSVA